VNPRLKAFLRILAENCAIAVVPSVFLYLLYDGVSFDHLRHVAVDSFVYVNVIVLLAKGTLPSLYPAVSRRGPVAMWTVFVSMLILISAVGSLLGSFILVGLRLESWTAFRTVLVDSFRLSVFLTLVIGTARVVFERIQGQLENTRLKLRTEELEHERALKLATEARLTSLEARLHPHFLFNTLNSISSLIPADPERAERMVERMAALLRFSLDAHQGGLVTLERELKIVRDYLEIEQARLGQRLRYQLDAGAELMDCALPPLSVQTLVENSIKYAVAPERQGGEIRVQAGRRNGCLQIGVADTGPGFTMDSALAGHGLDNLRSRLAALFGNAAELRVERRDGWTTVTLQVPAVAPEILTRSEAAW
jgi:two-component system sensor histidine kinase AlgZ